MVSWTARDLTLFFSSIKGISFSFDEDSRSFRYLLIIFSRGSCSFADSDSA
jgi:hypothetical protein